MRLCIWLEYLYDTKDSDEMKYRIWKNFVLVQFIGNEIQNRLVSIFFVVSPISKLLEEQATARYARYLESKPTAPMGGGQKSP